MPALGFDVALTAGRGPARGPAGGFSFRGRTLPAGATLTRGTPGTRVDESGQVATEPVDGARYDHDAVTRALRGLLVEDHSTNYFPSGSTPGAANGGPVGGVTVTADAGAAPDGTMTAARLQFDAGGGCLYWRTAPIAAGAPVAASVWVRSATAGAQPLQLRNYDDSLATILTGTATATSGWTRIVFPVNQMVGATPFNFSIDTRGVVGGDEQPKDLHVWMPQCEARPAAGSTIPTAGAPTTRSADVLRLDWGSRGAPDGAATVRYTFDDGSHQDVATTIANGTATVPTDLSRRWLRGATRL